MHSELDHKPLQSVRKEIGKDSSLLQDKPNSELLTTNSRGCGRRKPPTFIRPAELVRSDLDCKPWKVDAENYLRYLCQQRNLSIRQYLEIHNIMNNHLFTLSDWLSLPGTPKQKFISDITKLRKLMKRRDGVTMRRIASSFHLRSHPNFPYNW
ncbi:hypothetical protein [Pleurocapsa sp. PCC 7319]|uniref:hypothetical protein n=1 Tax=Pleurocapsa sp. PCC 7319 TaxID=118161 RepID=UPI001181B232|nr:hypothetical protein [Pleurocapsa sp. PCC 7319]